MNNLQKQYYYEMAKKDRLFVFYHNERRVCLITFYIDNNPDKYIREDMWSVLEDEPNGKTCIIDHLWTDKNFENRKISYKIWHYFKDTIKKNFPQVNYIFWVRAKINPISLKRERRIYTIPLRGRLEKCML